jgi:hypothetical protein
MAATVAVAASYTTLGGTTEPGRACHRDRAKSYGSEARPVSSADNAPPAKGFPLQTRQTCYRRLIAKRLHL